MRRRDYPVFDRAHLAYLNPLEKLNCAYCSYANGLLSFVKEVVGRARRTGGEDLRYLKTGATRMCHG